MEKSENCGCVTPVLSLGHLWSFEILPNVETCLKIFFKSIYLIYPKELTPQMAPNTSMQHAL